MPESIFFWRRYGKSQANPPELLEQTSFLSRAEIATILGCTPATVDNRRRKDPDFPQGRRVGPRLIRWKTEDIVIYMDRETVVA